MRAKWARSGQMPHLATLDQGLRCGTLEVVENACVPVGLLRGVSLLFMQALRCLFMQALRCLDCLT